MTTNHHRAANVIAEYTRTHPAGPYVVGLLALLNGEGLIAPNLPDPLDPEHADRTGAHTATRWEAYTTDGRGEHEETVYVDAYENEVWLCNSHDDLLDSDAARELAYALLAAADHVDNHQEPQ